MRTKQIHLLFLFIFIALQSSAITAYKGTLDLSAHSRQLNRLTPLDGEWAVYWNKLYTPQDLAHDSLLKNTEYTCILNPWKNLQPFSNQSHGFGVATYRLKIIMPKKVSENLVISLPQVFSSYKLYLNGSILYESGTIATTKSGYSPEWTRQIQSIELRPGENEIVLQVANFDHHYGGVFSPIVLGSPVSLEFKYHIK